MVALVLHCLHWQGLHIQFFTCNTTLLSTHSTRFTLTTASLQHGLPQQDHHLVLLSTVPRDLNLAL
jgi:hypothetical protein